MAHLGTGGYTVIDVNGIEKDRMFENSWNYDGTTPQVWKIRWSIRAGSMGQLRYIPRSIAKWLIATKNLEVPSPRNEFQHVSPQWFMLVLFMISRGELADGYRSIRLPEISRMYVHHGYLRTCPHM